MTLVSPAGISRPKVLGVPTVSSVIRPTVTGISRTPATGTPGLVVTYIARPAGIARTPKLGTPTLTVREGEGLQPLDPDLTVQWMIRQGGVWRSGKIEWMVRRAGTWQALDT